MAWRLAWIAAVVVGSFVFWHTGGRAAALCERERFVNSGSLSLWPPGTRCTFGEPATHDTLLNMWFLATLVVVVVIGLIVVELIERALGHRRG